MHPLKKKISGFKSGERVGQTVGLLRPKKCSENGCSTNYALKVNVGEEPRRPEATCPQEHELLTGDVGSQ
jgi:hypothetical protein